MNLQFVLLTLKCADADLRNLIFLLGVDPDSEEDMIDENFEAQLHTLHDLDSAIKQVESVLDTWGVQ